MRRQCGSEQIAAGLQIAMPTARVYSGLLATVFTADPAMLLNRFSSASSLSEVSCRAADVTMSSVFSLTIPLSHREPSRQQMARVLHYREPARHGQYNTRSVGTKRHEFRISSASGVQNKKVKSADQFNNDCCM
jgi:hypothetical protein